MPKGIIILGHWHTGSSILARAFAECGMETGNDLTGFDEDCEIQCEHGLLNEIGDQICIGNTTDLDEAQGRIQAILQSYVDQAEINNWSHYGVKMTHALQAPAWPAFKKAFENVWPDAKYIVCVRTPVAIIKSTASNPKWTPEKVVDSIKSTLKSTDELFRGKEASLLMYPTIWTSGGIRNVIERLGLTWKDNIMDLYKPGRQKTFTEEELIEFGSLF